MVNNTRDQYSNYTENVAFAIKKKYQTLMGEIIRTDMSNYAIARTGKSIGRDGDNGWGAFQYQVGRQSDTQNVAVFGNSGPLIVQ